MTTFSSHVAQATPAITDGYSFESQIDSLRQWLAVLVLSMTINLTTPSLPMHEVSDTVQPTSMSSNINSDIFKATLYLVEQIELLLEASKTEAAANFRFAARELIISEAPKAQSYQDPHHVASSLFVKFGMLVKQWANETDDLDEWYALGKILGFTTTTPPERFRKTHLLPESISSKWDHIAEQLLEPGEPNEALLDELIGEGMFEERERVQPLVCALLERGHDALRYELCHALLDFDVTIDPTLAYALEPLLDHSLSSIFMAALHLILKQEDDAGIRRWELLRDEFSDERIHLGDVLMRRAVERRG